MEEESNERHRIFKCLVYTGSDVLRDTVKRKMLINTSFEQYLNQNKHKFYHQFEKSRYKPCCSGNPHNCVVNGKMDRIMFFKMYNIKAELDTQDCLDRFEVNADISLDKLALTDLIFLLRDSKTLSTQEEKSLLAIMSTRNAICHISSLSSNEIENFWISLQNDLLLFAEPYRYKKSIEREIKTLKNYDHDLKLESKIMHESIDNMAKEETDGLKYAIKHGNESTKTDINKVQDLIENREKESRTMQCKKRIKAHVQREGMKTRLQSKRNRNSLDKRLSENREKESRTMQCKKRIKAHVQREGMKTRLQSKRNRNSLDKRLSAFQRTKERERTCRKSNKRKMIKMSEKAQEELIQHSKRLKTGKKQDIDSERTQEEMNQNSKRFKSMQTQQTDSEKKICKTVKSNKRRMDKMLELTQEEMNQNSKRFKSIQTQQTVSSTEKIEKIENVVKTSESFAEKYQSAMDKTYDDSKSLFKNDDINSYDHEVLSTVLINAEKTEDKVIQDPDLSRILQDSSMIKKQFCELFSDILADANVWIGVTCTCDTTIHNQYEGVPCRKGDCTIVIEKDGLATSDSVFPNQFLGLKTLYVNTTASHDYETATIAEKMMECPWRSPNKVPGTVAKELFKQHSNLTMVCPSNFKSTGFNSKNAELHGINCIQLFCKIKGIIPIGESHFPSTIDGVTTDVLEGTSQFSSVVHIGDKIYNEQNNIGTLGGFVKYYGIDTFLTCSHVIFGKNDFFKLQNKDIHFKCHTISNKDVPEPVECVLIRHSLKYDQQEKDMQVDAKTVHRSNLQDNPDETSIDAALLLIETPNKTKSSVSRNLLTSRSASAVAGTSRSKTNVAELTIKLYGGIDSTQSSFSEYGLDSIYLNDNVLDPEGITSRALSLSAFSGKQEKHVTIHKEKEILIPIPAHVRTRDNIIMYNQISLRNMEFQDGDSGTCIYGKCLKSGKKGCIGMFIGKSTSGQYIVTPMKDILDSLGIKNMP